MSCSWFWSAVQKTSLFRQMFCSLFALLLILPIQTVKCLAKSFIGKIFTLFAAFSNSNEFAEIWSVQQIKLGQFWNGLACCILTVSKNDKDHLLGKIFIDVNFNQFEVKSQSFSKKLLSDKLNNTISDVKCFLWWMQNESGFKISFWSKEGKVLFGWGILNLIWPIEGKVLLGWEFEDVFNIDFKSHVFCVTQISLELLLDTIVVLKTSGSMLQK